MARTKGLAARGFTVAEKRSLIFEKIALWVMFLVAIIAAVISFVALTWIGRQIGMGYVAPLVPLAIDGFAIACSVGIIRSQAEGERTRQRLSEWLGLSYALGLSLAGNIFHAVAELYGLPIPWWLVVLYASAPPVIVAYGLHVYGRAQHKGISAHVLAADPDQLHADLWHLGDEPAQPAARAARKPAAQPSAQAPRTEPAQPARTAGPVARTEKDELKDRARAEFDRMLAADPLDKPDAAAIHRAIDSPKNVATTRRWVQSWWEDHAAEMGLSADPIAEQVADTEAQPARLTA